MSKKGTYNGTFFNAFATRIRGTPIRFGVLIGTEIDEDGQRDTIFAAPTPPQVGEDGEAMPPAKDVAVLLASKTGDLTFADWAIQHMDAVRKLLPGGLEPCGCFATASEASARDLAPLLVQVLRGIKEPLVLTIDAGSSKPSFWQHTGGAKPALRPAQVKADPHKDALLLWAACPVDLVVPRSDDAGGEEAGADTEALAADLKNGLSAALRDCSVGASASPDAPMRVLDLGSDTGVGAGVPKGCSELHVTFLRSSTTLHALPNPEGRPCLRLRCFIVATAVVLRRSMELRGAVDLLRNALACSAASRLQLALDEAEGAGRTLALPYHTLRGLRGDLGLPLYCGDYCMPDEEPAAAQERLSQLLGVQESSFEEPPLHLDEWARLKSDFEGTYSASPQVSDDQLAKPASSKSSMTPQVAAIVVAIFVLLVAVVVPMLLR